MTDTLEIKLRELIAMKEGNKELAVFYEPADDSWSVHVGNPANCVMLGETWGQFHADGKTLESAISAVEVILRSNGSVKPHRDNA